VSALGSNSSRSRSYATASRSSALSCRRPTRVMGRGGKRGSQATMRKRALRCSGLGLALLVLCLTLPSRALACVVGTGAGTSCDIRSE
jgi:hypothetical protein